VQFLLAALQKATVEVHEVADFVDGTAPVLGRERVDSKDFHADRERAVGRVEE
jgi:hypothetical protein